MTALEMQALLRSAGDDERTLNRNGIQLLELDLSDTKLVSGVTKTEAVGKGIRFLRHSSNPGARLQLTYSGGNADKFWAPGKAMRGSFDGLEVKLAKGSARVGLATLAILKDSLEDFTEDLIISAIGPVDLLGSSDANGDVAGYVSLNVNTDPTGANPTGSFDGSGWELLRVLIDTGADGNASSFDLVPWLNPYYSGSNWFEQGIDRLSVPVSDATHDRFRALTVPWAGRGLGAFSIRNRVGAAAALSLIVQGLR